MRASIIRSLLWLPLFLSACAQEPGPSPGATAHEAPPTEEAARAWQELRAESATHAAIEWDAARRVAKTVTGSFPASPGEPVDAARDFLGRHAGVFGTRGTDDLVVSSVHESLVGTHVRFRQRASGLEVDGVEVSVHLEGREPSFRVYLVRSDYVPGLLPSPFRVDEASAAQGALVAAMLAGPPAGDVESVEAVALPDGRPGWRIHVRRERPARLLRVVVAGDDGAIVSARDILWRADGTGWVFIPNPMGATGDTTLTDNGDADSQTLTDARVQVTLRGLDGSGYLRGAYVDAKNPKSRAYEPSLVFDYTRASDSFEEVMAYYHLDTAQRRIQSLGFTNILARPIVANVNGTAEDNSWYDPSKKDITFGYGGVDDAEDADVILHEYGHAIQDDQVPGFGWSTEAGSVGEGFGDFFATLPHITPGPCLVDPACLAPWDSISFMSGSPPCMRRMDGTKHYPEAAVGEVHDDGEIWSAALWEIANAIGFETTLRLVLQSHFALSPSATFAQAARAIVQADEQLEGGAHVEAIRRIFTWRGLLADITPPASYAGEWGQVKKTVQSYHPYPNKTDQWFDITHPGAEAIRVHFSSFETQAQKDNVYLYDSALRLYAIYTGALGAFTSVAVPGDTVRVRLVSNATVQKRGYTIDAYEVPVAVLPDAGQEDASVQEDASAQEDAAQQDAAQQDAAQQDAGVQQDASGHEDTAAQEDAQAADGPSPQDGPVIADGGAPADGPPADAETGDGAVPTDGAAPADGAPPDSGSPDGGASSRERGCGCRTAAGPGATNWPLALLALLGALVGTRRRGRPLG